MRWRGLICMALVALCIGVRPQPLHGVTLFGLVDTGELFASVDGGATWTVRSTLAVSDAVAIAAAESSADLFMATRSGLVYRSSDGGVSWTAISTVAAIDVVDMAIRTNGDIFLLSRSGTLWVSTNSGVTFTAIASLTAANHVSLTGDSGGGSLYTLTETGEVARSSDFGNTWNTVGTIATTEAVAVRAVGLDLYVLTGTGDIARSTDQGASWQMVGTISQVRMAGLTRSGTDLVAATKEGLIATSGDAMGWSFVGSINQLTVVAIGNDTPTVTSIGRQPPTSSLLRVLALWPNPAPASANSISVMFELGQPGQVVMRVYDVAGKLVGRGAPTAFARSGEYTLRWNKGRLASGVYLVQLVSDGAFETQAKLTIVR